MQVKLVVCNKMEGLRTNRRNRISLPDNFQLKNPRESLSLIKKVTIRYNSITDQAFNVAIIVPLFSLANQLLLVDRNGLSIPLKACRGQIRLP